MQVHYNIDKLPLFKNAVITIGTFDGVHTGHQKIIDALINEAKVIDGESIIITFHPHPRKVVQADLSLELLNSLDEKIFLLESKQIDHLVVVPFTAAFASLTASEYIKDFLVEKIHPHTIIIGYDHHFGKDRKGNFLLLEEKKTELQYRLIEIPKHLLDEIAISSTQIRNALKKSDIEIANKLLGYLFFFSGLVVEGDKIGRTLGFPTANLNYCDSDKIRLGEGVYAVTVKIKDEQKKGMLSIGTRPTLSDTKENTEVNILEFDGDLYGSVLEVTVKKFLRSQVRYSSMEELKIQMAKDKENTLAAFHN
jgi:riboflavin kinase/FMN adenylyltransferase